MKPHCAYCCAHPGKIVVGIEHTSHEPHTSPASECRGCYEQYGPCPFCEKGRELEASGQYGHDGFWRGIMPKPSDVPETCLCYERPLGRDASLQRLNEMKERLTAYLADPSPKKTEVGRETLLSTVTADRVAAAADPPAAPTFDDDEIGTLL